MSISCKALTFFLSSLCPLPPDVFLRKKVWLHQIFDPDCLIFRLPRVNRFDGTEAERKTRMITDRWLLLSCDKQWAKPKAGWGRGTAAIEAEKYKHVCFKWKVLVGRTKGKQMLFTFSSILTGHQLEWDWLGFFTMITRNCTEELRCN